VRAPTLTAPPAQPAPPAVPPPQFESVKLSEPPSSAPVIEEGDAVPSSLEDAVMRELSDRSPEPGAAHVPTSNPPPIIEPSELRPRSSNPPADAHPEATSEERLLLPSIPPDAVVPDAISSEDLASEPASPGALEAASPVPDEATEAPPPTEAQHDTDVEGRYEALLLASTQPMQMSASPPPAPEKTQPLPVPAKATVEPEAIAEPAPAPAALPAAPRTVSAAPARSAWLGWALVVGAVAVIGGVALHKGPAPAAPTTPEPTAPAASSAAPASPAAPSTTPPADSFGELPPGVDVPRGFGMVEVSAPAGARIRIDGAIAGAGPSFSMVAAPGVHEVRVEGTGPESRSIIEVRASRTTRVDAAATP